MSVCQTNVLNLFLHEEKTLTYPGFEPGTFGFQVGNATNWAIEVVIEVIEVTSQAEKNDFLWTPAHNWV
jgi:hypothetical protein